MKIAVTGATGYIGSSLIRVMESKGIIPIALSRKKSNFSCEWLYYNLNDTVVNLPSDISCVIHLAMNFNLESDIDQEKEVESACRLIKAAECVGAKFIYLSSQTASGNAPTGYGKTKWKIEQIVTSYNGAIIRPGLVYGGRPLGLFAQLVKLVSRSPIIPNIIPSPKIQPIHVNDLCEAILSVAQHSDSSKVFYVASDVAIDFDVFLKQLAVNKLRVFRLKIPIPRLLISAVQRIVPNNPSLVRLKSLFSLPQMKTSDDLEFLSLKLRKLSSGLHSSGSSRRRSLIREGYIFHSYILRKNANIYMTRRYVKFVEVLRSGSPLGLANFLCFFPFLVALLDRNSALKNLHWYHEFMYRLNSATFLTEATIIGYQRYLNSNKFNSIIYAVFFCCKAIFFEILARAISLIVTPFISNIFVKKVDFYES